MVYHNQHHKHRRGRRRSFRLLPIMTAKTSDLSSYWTMASIILTLAIIVTSFINPTFAQSQIIFPQQPNFLLPNHNLENLRIPESKPVDSIVYQLKAADLQNEQRTFSYHMTGDTLTVDERTGEVRLVKPLDRERQANITVVVSVFDSSDFRNDQVLESRRRLIFIDDVDDSWPVFMPHKQMVSSPTSQGQVVYRGEVSEIAPSNSIVLSEIIVTDADEGPNADIVFECRPRLSSNSACDVFYVDSRRLATGRYSATIRVKGALDFEKVDTYKMTVVARGKRASPIKGTPLETEATINIDILNVQDEGPVFINAPYAISMVEGSPPGTRLLNLFVQDGDATPQRELSIIVTPGPFSEFFQINKDESTNMWYLEANNSLDRESALVNGVGNMFTISLLAAELNDRGEPVASENELVAALREPTYARGTLRKENVTVLVLDLPDSRPMFVRASTGAPLTETMLILNISESLSSGSSVPNLDLAVVDMDQGINSRFNLSLLDTDLGQPASAAFSLQPEVIYGKSEVVLNILNSSLIDYENPDYRSYRFNLVASKGMGDRSDEIKQMIELQINVMDSNDNGPEFEKEQFVFDIPEGSPAGSLVGIIKARDRDSGVFGRVEYTLRGVGASKFKLASSEGKILVNNCSISLQCLDYELQPSSSITYEARDGGGRIRNVSVIINLLDINDHAPRFSESIYRRELISDNLSNNHNYISPQLIVRAKDNDRSAQVIRSNLTYRITSTNLTGLDVDPNSGLVYLSQPLDLDSTIASSESSRLAAIGDRRLLFEAEVMAEDNGSPSQNATARIQLVVKGNSEGAPQFKQDHYQVLVREDQPLNRPFLQVQAIDPDDKDSHLRYSLGYDLNDLISMNAITGELSFKNQVDYDDFKGVPYNITVYTTDNSRPYPLRASATVSILIQDVNNKSPRFEQRNYRATLIQGLVKRGDTVARVKAVDPDTSARLEYSIMVAQMSLVDRNGKQFTMDEIANSSIGYLAQMGRGERERLVSNLRKLFTIDRTKGSLELAGEPDYEFAASINVPLRVLDLNQVQGEQQQDQVTVSIFLQTHNDRSPVFAPPWTVDRREYNITILEELPVGTVIFSLLAKDPISNEQIESFEKAFESDPRDYFRIDRPGVLVVNRRIDYEELPAPKRLLVSVKATSADNYHSAHATLNIQIADLNDNAPRFERPSYSASVSELISPGQEILTVSADDKDSGEFGQVFYSLDGLSSNLFAIDPKRGVLRLRRGAKLDRESNSSHSLFVVASDCNVTQSQATPSQRLAEFEGLTAKSEAGCKKSSALLNITLLDENDNEPVFVYPQTKLSSSSSTAGDYEALVSETASVGQVVSQVSAQDPDEGPNGQVSYEIVGGDQPVSRMLKVDREGYLSVAEPLSGLGNAKPYKLVVRAFDQAKQSPRQSFATVWLTISDVVANDGVPKFVRPKAGETVWVSESSGPGTHVFQVEAIDPDEGSTGKVMYNFVRPSEVFEIDPFTGIIKIQSRPNLYLDREQAENYSLVVVAHDLGSPRKQAHQVVSIRVSDANDNDPYFERDIEDHPLVLPVEEELPKGSLVGTIRAIDRDIGQNALIGYEIIEGNQKNLFRLSFDEQEELGSNSTGTPSSPIGNNECRIYTNQRLDREQRESYTLTIRASSVGRLRSPFTGQLRDPLGNRNPFNQYNASDLSKIRVTIKLLDVDDNKPVFVQQNPNSVVDSNADVYSQLMIFRAQDADSSGSDINYSIVDALFYSDANLLEAANYYTLNGIEAGQTVQPVSMKHVFDIGPSSGILRNTVSMRPYIDGYFEVFVRADSGPLEGGNTLEEAGETSTTGSSVPQTNNRCHQGQLTKANNASSVSPGIGQFAELENCHVAITKAVIFVAHQRETFRLVFNKSRLNDRLDEFKGQLQKALEEMMFEPARPAAVHEGPSAMDGAEPISLDSSRHSVIRSPERVVLNTLNTDFYEREDGSLDFSTLTSCSQLVRFDDRSPATASGVSAAEDGSPKFAASATGIHQVPNQVIEFEEVLNLFKSLNSSLSRQQQQQQQQQQSPQVRQANLFAQYGLVGVERCIRDRQSYRMTPLEKASLYMATVIALASILLALIVSRMRKSYERNLKLLQRSKYQYAGPYGTLQGLAAVRLAPHHLSLSAIPSAAGGDGIAW